VTPGPAATGPTTGGGARGPRTPGVGVQPTPRAGTTGPRRWTADDFQRGATSLELLAVDWDLYVEDLGVGDPDQGTRARSGTLSREDAIAQLRGDDPRPLLVLRDCRCGAHHGGLLQDRLAPESLRLMSRWFHCVRLPEAAVAEPHPMAALFADEPWHVLLEGADDDVRAVAQARPGELLRQMRGVLDRRFETRGDDGYPARLKQLAKLLDAFDRLDADETRGRMALDDELDRSGASRRAQVLEGELDKALASRDALRARWDELGELTAR